MRFTDEQIEDIISEVSALGDVGNEAADLIRDLLKVRQDFLQWDRTFHRCMNGTVRGYGSELCSNIPIDDDHTLRDFNAVDELNRLYELEESLPRTKDGVVRIMHDVDREEVYAVIGGCAVHRGVVVSPDPDDPHGAAIIVDRNEGHYVPVSSCWSTLELAEEELEGMRTNGS